MECEVDWLRAINCCVMMDLSKKRQALLFSAHESRLFLIVIFARLRLPRIAYAHIGRRSCEEFEKYIKLSYLSHRKRFQFSYSLSLFHFISMTAKRTTRQFIAWMFR